MIIILARKELYRKWQKTDTTCYFSSQIQEPEVKVKTYFGVGHSYHWHYQMKRFKISIILIEMKLIILQ